MENPEEIEQNTLSPSTIIQNYFPDLTAEEDRCTKTRYLLQFFFTLSCHDHPWQNISELFEIRHSNRSNSKTSAFENPHRIQKTSPFWPKTVACSLVHCVLAIDNQITQKKISQSICLFLYLGIKELYLCRHSQLNKIQIIRSKPNNAEIFW